MIVIRGSTWMSRRGLFGLLGLAFGVLLLIALYSVPPPSQGQDAVTWKIAHTPVPGSAYEHTVTKSFPSLVEKATDGRVKVDVIAGAVGALDTWQAASSGRFDGASILSMSYVCGEMPKACAPALPGLVNKEEMPAVINQFLFDAVRDEALARDNFRLVMMSYWSQNYYFSNVELDEVKDFRGNKFRAFSTYQAKHIDAVGGSAISMPFSELYSALDRGMVDAYASGVLGVMGSGLNEVTKFMSRWPTGQTTYMIVINSDSWNELSDDLKSKLDVAFETFQRDSLEYEIQQGEALLKKATDEGGMQFTEIKPGEVETFVQIAKDQVWPQWMNETGDEGKTWIEQVQAIVNEQRSM